MSLNKSTLIDDIKKLSNTLDAQYGHELNLRNHCYLRIAYDCVVDNKWDLEIKKPFVKYASIDQLQLALALLQKYQIDKKKLLADNKKSLKFRILNQQTSTDQLFVFKD
jgi:hypothetical protein